MSLVSGAEFRHYGFGTVDLGIEPPIETARGRRLVPDRRSISLRWLAAVVLTGLAGSGLIGATIYAALDGQMTLGQAPELASNARRANIALDRPVKGDRLVRSADIVAEKQSFRIPTTVKVGDKQIVKIRGFTRVSTTLALAPTGSEDIPEFNPLKLLASDVNPPDVQADSGAVPDVDDAEVSFTTQDLNAADPALYGPSLSREEIDAQVGDYGRTLVTVGRIPLPPQLLLMRTSRAGLLPPSELGFADPLGHVVPFSSIEVRMVPENVTVIPRSDPSREGRVPDDKLVVFRHGDQLDDVLKANGATREQTRSIINAFTPARGEPPVADGRRLKFFYAKMDDGKPPQIARLSVYADENLETTIALADNGTYVQIAPAEGGQKAMRPAPSGDEGDNGGFRLYDSLYETSLKQDVPRPMIDSLVRIFANDVDFQRGVAGGDSLDAFYADGESDDPHPELLYASITVHNEIYKYYRFQAPDDGSVDYYDENGRSVRKFLMRSPVPNAVITSGFGLRFHPILGYTRPHTGVDWAAPIGTPILAAGNGTVLRAQRESGYGNHVEIEHANGYVTTYSHMSGFGRGIVAGARIRQGQVVGFLGQTGLATGPHLHYEVIVNGHFVDPMKVKLARTREMDGKLLADFKHERDRIDGLMASGAIAAPAGGVKRASN